MLRITLLLIMAMLTQPFYAQSNKYNLLIGTYTNSGKSQGIYSYVADMKTGELVEKSVTSGTSNPGFLAIAPDGKFVYSVSENNEGSAAVSFSFNKMYGTLSLINRSSTQNPGPCYISATKKHVFTANYNGGSISVFGRNPDGSLTEIKQLIKHEGKSINNERQNQPHVHQVLMTPDNKFLIANDLGTDKVMVYKYNAKSQSEILTIFETFTAKPGSGPRHSTLSKDGKRLYLLQELDGTISVLTLKNGRAELIQETSVMKNNNVNAWAADIHLSPDGKYLYATNRTPANDITCFFVGKDGRLTFRQQISTGGVVPRNFAITPDGSYLFVAHQDTDNVVIFKLDKKSGELSDTGKRISVGSPVCLVFY